MSQMASLPSDNGLRRKHTKIAKKPLSQNGLDQAAIDAQLLANLYKYGSCGRFVPNEKLARFAGEKSLFANISKTKHKRAYVAL